MSNGKYIKFGEIWLVQFDPSVGHEFQKSRPAVVVQSDSQIKKSNLVTIAPLSSNLSNRTEDDIIIKKSGQNKLFLDSIIKVYDIVSFDYSRFIKKIGIVENEMIDQVKAYLKKHFDI